MNRPAIADPEFNELLRRTRVTRGDARRSAERSLTEYADQTEDVSPEAYTLLMSAAPELLMLASPDPHVRHEGMGRLRTRAYRYARLVRTEVAA